MVRLAYTILYDNLHCGKPAQWRGGLFMVAEDAAHQQKLKEMLLGYQGVYAALSAADIFCIGPDGTLHLSDEEVAGGVVRDFAVVITSKRLCSGYTLSRLKASISGVYAGNQAQRLQLSGRINRLSQAATELDYYVVHAGILTQMLKYHAEAASIDAALKSMGVLIEMHGNNA